MMYSKPYDLEDKLQHYVHSHVYKKDIFFGVLHDNP